MLLHLIARALIAAEADTMQSMHSKVAAQEQRLQRLERMVACLAAGAGDCNSSAL